MTSKDLVIYALKKQVEERSPSVETQQKKGSLTHYFRKYRSILFLHKII